MSHKRKDFAAWYESLTPEEREDYAQRANTTCGYIESHLLGPYKIPRPQGMSDLALASGEFTVGELAAWFYQSAIERMQRQGRRPSRRAA